MANKLQLTEKLIRRLVAEKSTKRRYFTDATESGLRIEISSAGSVRFFTRITVKGKVKPFEAPAKWPQVTVADARIWMQNLKADLNRRVTVQSSNMGKISLNKYFYELYVPNHLEVEARRSAARSKSVYRCNVEPVLGMMDLRDITRPDVIDMRNASNRRTGPPTANAAKILVHRIFSHAIDSGEIASGNPAARIPNLYEVQRDRFLMPHEVPQFFEVLLSDKVRPMFRSLVVTGLFTGARPANCMAIRKSCIIPGLPTWRIPADEFKGKRNHYLPLVGQVVANLELQSQVVTGDHFHPSARSNSGHMESPNRQWSEFRDLAGLDDLRLVDLRPTLATWAEDMNVPETIRGKMLGHAEGGIIARYSRSKIETVLKHFQPVADAIEAAADVKPAKIISIAKAANIE